MHFVLKWLGQGGLLVAAGVDVPVWLLRQRALARGVSRGQRRCKAALTMLRFSSRARAAVCGCGLAKCGSYSSRVALL